MKTFDGQSLKIGDAILRSYHDVTFVGVIRGFDGSGCIYVDFPAPLPQPVVYGIPREGICIHYFDTDPAHLVSRPAEVPELVHLPSTCVGGSSAKALPLPSLPDLEAAGKAAVTRGDKAGATALRAAYRAVRDAQIPAA